MHALSICCGILLLLNGTAGQLGNDESDLSLPPNGTKFRRQAVNPRVIGGIKAVEKQFPYMATVKYTHNDYTRCSGVILTRNWVLTSGLCVFNCTTSKRLLPRDLLTTAGEVIRKTSTEARQWRSIFWVISHENYTCKGSYKPTGYDLGLLMTQEPFVFDEYVNAVPLRRKPVTTGDRVQLVGWGCSKQGYQEYLLYAEVPIYTREKCLGLIDNDINAEGTVCVGFFGEEFGDAGGGVIINGLLAAVISHSFKNHAKRPGLANDVPYFLPWIESIIDFRVKSVGRTVDSSSRSSSTFFHGILLTFTITISLFNLLSYY